MLSHTLLQVSMARQVSDGQQTKTEMIYQYLTGPRFRQCVEANQFRMTQTRDKLARERVRNQTQAIQTHEQVGKEVRDAIKRIGGTPPENNVPAEHIKEVQKRLKSATPKLKLDERDAGGLLGEVTDSTRSTGSGKT